MVLLLLCCLLLFAQGWRRMTTLPCAALSLSLVAVSQSSTAIVMTLGLCLLAPVLLTRNAPAPLRLLSYIAGLTVVSLALWRLLAFDMDPVDLALTALGKERTLTGRSVLWAFALRMIEARPWFGNGSEAFWKDGTGVGGGKRGAR